MSSKFYLAVLTLVALCQPLHAADKKADARREALVAAVQAVSPDALGGRLGLNIASQMTPKAPTPVPATRSVVKSTARSADLLGYQLWKRAQKS